MVRQTVAGGCVTTLAVQRVTRAQLGGRLVASTSGRTAEQKQTMQRVDCGLQWPLALACCRSVAAPPPSRQRPDDVRRWITISDARLGRGTTRPLHRDTSQRLVHHHVPSSSSSRRTKHARRLTGSGVPPSPSNASVIPQPPRRSNKLHFYCVGVL